MNFKKKRDMALKHIADLADMDINSDSPHPDKVSFLLISRKMLRPPKVLVFLRESIMLITRIRFKSFSYTSWFILFVVVFPVLICFVDGGTLAVIYCLLNLLDLLCIFNVDITLRRGNFCYPLAPPIIS